MPRPPTERYCIIRRYRRADGTCDAKLLEAGVLTHERPFAAIQRAAAIAQQATATPAGFIRVEIEAIRVRGEMVAAPLSGDFA